LAYWTTEPGWSTELLLRNNLESQELIVVPAVRTAGVETALPSVTIKPGDVASLDLYETLMKVAPQLAGAWGSLVLRYRSAPHRSLYASAMVRATGRPIVFHLDALERGSKYETGSREGIWWLPRDPTTGYLILTNSGEQELQPTLTIYDCGGKAWQQTLSLGALQSQRLSMRYLLQQPGLTGSYGGIKIDIAKGARYLDSVHLLFEGSGAFSAIMKMFTHDPNTTLSSRSFGGVKEWTTRAPMLALSNPDPALGLPAGTTLQPEVFIRNATGKTFTAHIHFNWRSATTSGESAPLDLAFKPNETQMIDVAALQAQKLLPSDAYWAVVILSAPVLPDELLAIAASYDQTGRYGTQTPFSDQLASHWEGGKWEVDGTHDSLVTVANGSNKPALAQLTILYNQGTGQYQLEQTLAPGQQMALDFGELIRDAVPDKNGHTLPSGLTSGTYRLLDLNANPLGSLYEGKEIVDKTWGHATYTCMICCGPETPRMLYDPLSVLINGFVDQGVQALDSCSQSLSDITDDFPTWWTDNTSIATASGYEINGVGVGATNHYAQSINMYWGRKIDSGGSDCPLSQEEPSANTNVTPGFTVGYNAYIPVDHVSGPSGCTWAGGQGVSYIYMGDAYRGTFRAAESIQVVPDVQQSSGFFQDTGQTRQYGYGSPANGSTLSSQDEDGIPNDCYLWNNSGKAIPAFPYDVTFPYPHQGQVHYSGSASNPLESSLATIQWDMRTVLDTTNPQSPTAYVNYNHTCYPAHQIKVNGSIIYSYQPSYNDPNYLYQCLTLHVGTVIGQTNPVGVPTH
jgi:hypothetical protein